MQIHEILYTCTQDPAFPTLKIWLRSLHCKVFDNHINTVCQKIAISKMCQIAGALQVFRLASVNQVSWSIFRMGFLTGKGYCLLQHFRQLFSTVVRRQPWCTNRTGDQLTTFCKFGNSELSRWKWHSRCHLFDCRFLKNVCRYQLEICTDYKRCVA